MTQPCPSQSPSNTDPPPTRQPLLFEALSSPVPGLSGAAIRRIALALILAAGISGAAFAWLGAWPVFGFMGAEVLLVVGLLSAHARWSARAYERISLADGRLVIERADGRGRRERLEIDPYWARAEWRETAPGEGRLLITTRGRALEIGRFLNGPERQSLHGALSSALAAWRRPDYDNPQLRVALGDPIRPGTSPG
jgi:uncharacterized membrane protein